MAVIIVNKIEMKRIVEHTNDVHFLINEDVNLYVALERESIITALDKIKTPFSIQFIDEVDINKNIPSSASFDIIVESSLIPNLDKRKRFFIDFRNED